MVVFWLAHDGDDFIHLLHGDDLPLVFHFLEEEFCDPRFDISDDFVAPFCSRKGSFDGLQITQQFLICILIDMKKHIGQIYIYSLVHFTSF